MGNERVIFSNRFDRPTLEQIEEEMKNKNYDDNENLMSADEFLEFMKQNRRTVPNEKRIANKDKFIWAVRELSETYEIDADLIKDDDGYTASLYMNYLDLTTEVLSQSFYRAFGEVGTAIHQSEKHTVNL